MKKFTLIVTGLALAASAMAQSFSADGVKYSVIEGSQNVRIDGVASYQVTQLTVPPSVEYEGTDYNVTEVGICAFSGCNRLSELILPQSITTLERNCFSGTGLTSMTIPSNVTEISRSAFEGCSKLESVVLPEGFTKIGVSAFYDCDKLTTMPIPATVKQIGNAAFGGCTALTEVDFLGTVIDWMQIEFADEGANPCSNGAALKCKGREVVAINVMPKVGKLRPYAFSGCTSLVSVDIMDGITEIGTKAFSNCTSLESITFPDHGLTSISEWAFQGCETLKKVMIPSVEMFLSVEMGGLYANPLTYGASLIVRDGGSYSTPLADLVIPAAITEIGQYAFIGCSSLKTVTLHDGVTAVGASAFQGCKALESVTFPAVSGIGMAAFRSCVSLKSVVLPETVAELGEQAFMDCQSLASVGLPSTLTSLPAYIFSGCGSLATIGLPDGVEIIGASAFHNCISLSAVNFPQVLNQIEERAFMGTAIPYAIIESPELSRIGGQAFYGSTALTEVSLPASVTFVGPEAFAMSSPSKFTCLAVTPPTTAANLCDEDVYTSCPLYVPEQSVTSYRAANGWSKFHNISSSGLSSIDGVEAVEDNAPAVYYNLQGERVEVPGSGLYIVMRGYKVTKERL